MVARRYDDMTKKAVAVFEEMWNEEIRAGYFADGRYNVYGRAPKGMKTAKLPLDPHKVLMLQNFLVDQRSHGIAPDKTWQICVNAIHKKLLLLVDKENLSRA